MDGDLVSTTCDEGWPHAEAFLTLVDVEELGEKAMARATGAMIGAGSPRALHARRVEPDPIVSRLWPLVEMRRAMTKGACAWGDFVRWMRDLTPEAMMFIDHNVDEAVMAHLRRAYEIVLERMPTVPAARGEVN
jgi:hypothetical protein